MSERRLSRLKAGLWTLVGVLAAVTFVRFTRGLGAVTNLSDGTPWGLWIGFDVMGGVALAAGGFVLAATVYIFGLERYRPFVRAAVLTAMLGYAAVAAGLLYDLGLPWNIWHPLVHWQYHSVLFEVAMCVMLYLTVLMLEFAPTVLEHPRFAGRPFRVVLGWLKKATIALVITGIVLSTLHQSSLGSLFLITPYRLDPLWYSHIIYVLFFVSAVGLGLMTVVLETGFAAHYLGHRAHARELSGLGLAAAVVLWLYIVLRVGDLALRGELPHAVDGSARGMLFLVELAVSAIIPATMLLFRRVRASMRGVGMAAAFTVGGMVLYRLDVSVLAFARPAGFGYFPSWEEFAVTIGLVAAFALIFLFFVEHLRVYDDVPGALTPRRRSYDPAAVGSLLPSRVAAVRRNSGAALAGATVALLFLPVAGRPPVRTPTAAARTVGGIVENRGGQQVRALRLAMDPAGEPGLRDSLLLLIDGNRNGDGVLFAHAAHMDRLGGNGSCGICHHLNMPLAQVSGCFECHRDMYEPTSLFDHTSHVAALEGNGGCGECHSAQAKVKSYETATACADCHRTQAVAGAVISSAHARWADAASYQDAMHDLCVKCHQQKIAAAPERYPATLGECRNCHDADLPARLRQLEPSRSVTARPTVVASDRELPGRAPARLVR